MRLGKAERRACDQIAALAGLNFGPQLTLTEVALALGRGPLKAASSIVAIGQADMALQWSFSDLPAFDEHVWRYFARLGRIDRIKRAAARAVAEASTMPILSTADFPQLTRRTTIYRELMVPCGIEHILRILVPAPGPVLYSFAFGRPRKAATFTAREKAFALHLMPLLHRAASACAASAAVEADSDVDEAFLLFGRPDASPESTPGSDQILRLAGGGGADGREAGLAIATALARTGGARELDNAFGHFSFRAQPLGQPARRTVVAVERAIPAAAMALRRAAQLDLPLRQMELAARIAAGATLEEAAASMSLSLNTARNYSRLIYARLGLDGRDALSRILTSGAEARA